MSIAVTGATGQLGRLVVARSIRVGSSSSAAISRAPDPAAWVRLAASGCCASPTEPRTKSLSAAHACRSRSPALLLTSDTSSRAGMSTTAHPAP